MSEQLEPSYFKILPIVTGKGEEIFLPQFLCRLLDTGKCCFVSPRKIGQLSPRSTNRRLEMVQAGKQITNRQEEIGLAARRFLAQDPSHLVILVDDLEDRCDEIKGVFELYRSSLDVMLQEDQKSNASVHFLVPMVEAYFFADVTTLNEILDTAIEEIDGDPEAIKNPKASLKRAVKAIDGSKKFDEKNHGLAIAKKIDLLEVLSNPETCRSLRSLVKWCSRKIGDVDSERFQLLEGDTCHITGRQIPEAKGDTAQ